MKWTKEVELIGMILNGNACNFHLCYKFSESLGREYPEVWENRDEWYKLCGFRYGKSKRTGNMTWVRDRTIHNLYAIGYECEDCGSKNLKEESK